MRFPLKLSCGHLTNEVCNCWKDHKTTYQYKEDSESPIDKALHQFNGRWRDVLSNYGCNVPSGRNHGPCPVCGGKDRFRFDDKQGRGTWFCSQCDPQSGGGLLLLSRFLGKPTMDTAKELVGEEDFKSIAPKREFKVVDETELRKQNIEQAKKGAALMIGSAIQSSHPYMDKKGLAGEWLVNGEEIYSRDGILTKGHFLLVPVHKKGELVNVQKITADGEKKPLFGGDMQGVQHIISGKENSIAITEGYATGVTVNKLTGYKTYVSFNTGNLAEAVKQAKADHPSSKIVIFGDHDKLDEQHNRRPGEYYANEAAAPFGATVALPPTLGDWDDYRKEYGEEICKQAMRKAIVADMEKQGTNKPVLEIQHKAILNNNSVQCNDDLVKYKTEVKKPVEEIKKTVPPVAELTTPAPTPAFGSWMGGNSTVKQKPKGLKELPPGICLDSVDVDSPPGLAGDIVEYMKAGAHRKLEGGAFSAMAIQCMAMAGSNLKGFKGGKLSLITITLGVSASGKDRAQGVIKQLLNDSGINVYGDIRSDKDVIRSAAYDDGRCFYIKDEAHSLLGGALGGKEKHTSGVPATLMEMATTTLFKLSKLHMEEFEGSIIGRKQRLEKMLTAKEDIRLGYNPDLEKAKITVIDKEIADIRTRIQEQDRVLDSIEHGIKNPALNLAALSTPQKLASIIDEDSIESGFLGRALIFDCGVERVQNDKLNNYENWLIQAEETHENKMLWERVKVGVALIAQMSGDINKAKIEDEFRGIEYKTVATPEASRMMFDIAVHYDQYQYLNHARLGALYARIGERVMSVSSSLALYNVIDGNVTIEKEHVLYALYVALKSIDHLESNLRVNEAADGDTIESKIDGIKEAIMKRLHVNKGDKDEGWRYKSKIKEYLKRQPYYRDIAKDLLKHNQDAFENSIMSLRGEGKLEVDGAKLRLKK